MKAKDGRKLKQKKPKTPIRRHRQHLTETNSKHIHRLATRRGPKAGTAITRRATQTVPPGVAEKRRLRPPPTDASLAPPQPPSHAQAVTAPPLPLLASALHQLPDSVQARPSLPMVWQHATFPATGTAARGGGGRGPGGRAGRTAMRARQVVISRIPYLNVFVADCWALNSPLVRPPPAPVGRCTAAVAVHVRNRRKKTIAVQIRLSDYVSNLAAKARAKGIRLCAGDRLLYRGTELRGHLTLADYNIPAGGTVDVAPRRRGGMDRAGFYAQDNTYNAAISILHDDARGTEDAKEHEARYIVFCFFVTSMSFAFFFKRKNTRQREPLPSWHRFHFPFSFFCFFVCRPASSEGGEQGHSRRQSPWPQWPQWLQPRLPSWRPQPKRQQLVWRRQRRR